MQSYVNLIVFICLLMEYSSSNYTQCTSHCSQITVPFLNPFSIPVECQNNNTNIYNNALVCLIDYRIDYDAKQIYINFKASNDTKILKDDVPSEFLSQSVWLGFNQQANQPNITHRTYECNIQPDCGRLFYFHTIERLITDGLAKLEEIKSILYNQSITKRRCRDSRARGNQSISRCPNGLCYALNIEKKQYCTSDQTAILFSEIEYRSPKFRDNERELIEYKCNRNFCNGNEIMEKIKNLLRDYTHGEKKKKKSKAMEVRSSTNHHTFSSYLVVFLWFIRNIFL